MRHLRFELTAMALAVLLAGISVIATYGSARTGDLVFCRIVDEDRDTAQIVVGVTTDCDRPAGDTRLEIGGGPSTDAAGTAPRVVVGRSHDLVDAFRALDG